MVNFLGGATEFHWVGLSETFYLGIASMKKLFKRFERFGLRNSSNVFPLFQDCYKSI